MRVSRGCYDKYRRCPGWAGGGTNLAAVVRCDDGTIETHGRLWRWRFWRCPTCGVVVWPSVTRWFDPGWWHWKLVDWGFRKPSPRG